MTDFKAIAAALDQRGFCVVPEFLSREEIDFLVAEFDASPDYSPPTKTRHAAQHLGDKPVAGQTGALRANAMGRRETFQRIGPRIEEFAQGVTGAKAALYQILYLQTPVTDLSWHQDHDHFFLTEYNRTHLNYWIPLVKPSRSEAGLRVIPWDRLREKSPRVFNLCRRSGASRLYSLRDGGILYLSDWSGVSWQEEYLEIEEVMETPEVGPGDLLLLRVNTIHATQTTEDRRVAVSLRTCDPATPIDWHRVAGSPTMAKMQRLGGFRRQLRSGYDQRPAAFPHSIILCGVRDVRDYRIHSTAENRLVLGGSAFNIKSESLRLGDFSEQEVRALLGQHTAATGQAFTEEAVRLILTRTAGQPWLVNALCYDACFRHVPGRERARPITADAILEAQERLILRRDTHIDDLAHKLQEERVRRVVEPILTGAGETACSNEDLAYVRDLGLVAQADDGPPRIANPIYAEVVPRHLNYAVQETLPQQMAWYVGADGGLDVEGLIAAFQEFFREHSEHWVQRFEQYHEAGPQLLLQAHLQRVVNGGGRLEREYALGRGRTDLLIVWPQGGRERRFVVECKVLRKGLERTIAEGMEQTRGYVDRCGAEAGHLIVFDRAPDRPWADKIFRRTPAGAGVPVTVWGM